MAKIAILTDTNNPIGTPRSIPDTAIPLLNDIFGGATNADTANNTLNWIVQQLREYVRKEKLARRRATDQGTVEIGQVSEEGTLNTSWPTA